MLEEDDDDDEDEEEEPPLTEPPLPTWAMPGVGGKKGPTAAGVFWSVLYVADPTPFPYPLLAEPPWVFWKVALAAAQPTTSA